MRVVLQQNTTHKGQDTHSGAQALRLARQGFPYPQLSLRRVPDPHLAKEIILAPVVVLASAPGRAAREDVAARFDRLNTLLRCPQSIPPPFPGQRRTVERFDDGLLAL